MMKEYKKMTTSISEAKKVYVETGRLNRNVISKEISISWYKCKLQNLSPDMHLKSCGHHPDRSFEEQFEKYIESIVPDPYQYVLANHRLETVSSRLIDQDLLNMDTIDDLYIGTNGGYIAYKTDQTYTVSEDEHYLDLFNQYFTTGILIKKASNIIGILMLISEEMPTAYALNNLSLKINAFNDKSLQILKSNHSMKYLLSDFLIYPDAYLSTIKEQIEKIELSSHPILIEGSLGSGKTSLAWYLGLKNCIPVTLSLKELPKSLHKQVIETALYQNDTVIIEDLHVTTDESIGLLIAYTEEKYKEKNTQNSFKYKCKSLILTMVNTNFDITKYAQCWQNLMSRLNLRRIVLKNLSEFPLDTHTIVTQFIKRTNLDATDVYVEKLVHQIKNETFSALNEAINLSQSFIVNQAQPILDYLPSNEQSQLQTLEQNEKTYLLKIYHLMDQNVTATAEVLNIGRATLYRKLEKYHNET